MGEVTAAPSPREIGANDRLVAKIEINSHRQLRVLARGGAHPRISIQPWDRPSEAADFAPQGALSILPAQLDAVIGALIDSRNVLLREVER